MDAQRTKWPPSLPVVQKEHTKMLPSISLFFLFGPLLDAVTVFWEEGNSFMLTPYVVLTNIQVHNSTIVPRIFGCRDLCSKMDRCVGFYEDNSSCFVSSCDDIKGSDTKGREVYIRLPVSSATAREMIEMGDPSRTMKALTSIEEFCTNRTTNETQTAVNNTNFDGFVNTWSLVMDGESTERANNLTDCFEKCDFPSCLAFRYDNQSEMCAKANCSHISLSPTDDQPLTFLRTLHDDPREIEKTISMSSCLGQEMYYDSERSGNMSMMLTRYVDGTNGYKLFTPEFDKPSQQNVNTMELKDLGLVISLSASNNTNNSVVVDMDSYRNATSLCPDPNCFQLLCVTDVTTFRATIGNPNSQCSDVGGSFVTYGMVARNACCGATLPVKEYVSATNGLRFYADGVDSIPATYEPSGVEFYLWQPNYNLSTYH